MRGPVLGRRARAVVSGLPREIAERELAEVRARLGWDASECVAEEDAAGRGAGNVLVLEVATAGGRAVFTALGERGRRAERVAAEACDALRAWESADVPVEEHLADQLMLPMALSGGGTFRTTGPTSHARTNAGTIARFLPARFAFGPEPGGAWRVTCEGAAAPG